VDRKKQPGPREGHDISVQKTLTITIGGEEDFPQEQEQKRGLLWEKRPLYRGSAQEGEVFFHADLARETGREGEAKGVTRVDSVTDLNRSAQSWKMKTKAQRAGKRIPIGKGGLSVTVQHRGKGVLRQSWSRGKGGGGKNMK